MGYSLALGQKAPLFDQNGDQIVEGDTTAAFDHPTVAHFAAEETLIFLVADTVGETAITITPTGGEGVTHTVTVTAGGFDWSLGAPVTA